MSERNSIALQGAEAEAPFAVDEPESISAVAERAHACVKQELESGRSDFSQMDSWSDGVVIKNSEGVIVYSNQSHQRMFTPGSTPVGRTSQAYLDPPMAQRSDRIEQLVLDGVPYIECEHSGYGPDGSVYRVQVRKCSLRTLAAPGFALLGVMRIVERSETDKASRALDLSAASERFKELGQRDQEICRHTALGVSSRELGERLGMTTRGIELRKQKAFAKLGVSKAVDLARLLVRLQDRGYLDLGV